MFKEGESDLLGHGLLVDQQEEKQVFVRFGKMEVVGDFVKNCSEIEVRIEA